MDITEEEQNQEISEKPKPKKSAMCIICGAKAEFFIRGVPSDTYCGECADDLFGREGLDTIE
jgi:hypothetical protein